MKIEIETYKGQLIEYDDSYDKFICDISTEDKFKSVKRLSLVDLRKEIDQFIKLNADFKPFQVLAVDSYDKSDFEILNVSAIRTDGKFVTYSEGNENYKSHKGKKDTQKWMVYNPDIVKQKSEFKKIKDLALTTYSNNLKSLIPKLIPIDLTKYDHIINAD